MEKTVNVTVERIYRLDSDSALKGFADISLCDSVVLKGLRIVEGKKGLFVGMPQQLGKDGLKVNQNSIANARLFSIVPTPYHPLPF
jgi:DNA-binding cell septation regulator SpoVG